MPLYPRPLPGLRATRQRKGMTQQGLAFTAGLHVSAVSRIEQGTNEAKAATAVRLAHALGVRVEELTGGVPAPLGVVPQAPEEPQAEEPEEQAS